MHRAMLEKYHFNSTMVTIFFSFLFVYLFIYSLIFKRPANATPKMAREFALSRPLLVPPLDTKTSSRYVWQGCGNASSSLFLNYLFILVSFIPFNFIYLVLLTSYRTLQSALSSVSALTQSVLSTTVANKSVVSFPPLS